jgi:hypothetical protein
MFKLKIIFIVALAILGVLAIFTFIPQASSGKTYTEVAREHIIQQPDGYLVQFDIINHESQDITYKVIMTLDNNSYGEEVNVPAGHTYTYGHYIYPDKLASGIVNLVVTKAGDPSPIADINYHLK